MDLTQDQLKELLNYDPETGLFTWKASASNRVKVGAVVGSKDRQGYLLIRVLGRLYKSHRLAWLYVYGVWPEQEVDHINGKKADNRIENLRVADKRLNVQNQRRAHKNSKTGLLGVALDKRRNKYAAFIRFDGKNHFLGYFPTGEQAHAAYLAAKRQHHAGCTI